MTLVGQIVVVNGERREAVEEFRACGVNWVRYELPNGSNGYASDTEWLEWYDNGQQ